MKNHNREHKIWLARMNISDSSSTDDVDLAALEDDLFDSVEDTASGVAVKEHTGVGLSKFKPVSTSLILNSSIFQETCILCVKFLLFHGIHLLDNPLHVLIFVGHSDTEMLIISGSDNLL